MSHHPTGIFGSPKAIPLQQPPRTRIPVFSVLDDRYFRAIWYAGSLHEISRRMELLVLSWLILQTTNSPFQLGLVLVFNNLPRPVLSLFSGIIADRYSRFHIMLAAQAVNALVAGIILVLILLDAVSSWHVFLAVSMQGITKSMDDPSRRTGILDIVGEGRLVNALALDQIGNTVGKMAGPFLGGILLGAAGFDGAYLAVVVGHLLAMGFLTRVRIPARQTAIQREPVWGSLSASLKYALHSPILLGMLYVTILMNALAFPVQQFIPAIGRDHLGVGPALVGLLVAAEGLGQLLGAGLMALTTNFRYHGRVFAIGSVAVLMMVILFVWSPWYALAFAFLTIGGIGQAGFGTMQSTITMLSAPPGLRGRMMGLMSFCIGLGTPLGTLEIGAVAVAFSTQWAISVNALAGLWLMLPALLLTPLVRQPSAPLLPEIRQQPSS